MLQRNIIPFSQLAELRLEQLALRPFSMFRAVHIDNNSFYRALGFILSLRHQLYQQQILSITLDRLNLDSHGDALLTTDFTKLRTTFFALLARFKQKYASILELKVTQFLENRPYADVLLVLMVRNYLLQRFKDKLELNDQFVLKNYLSEPTEHIVALAHQCFNFHFYQHGKEGSCSHETFCYYFYAKPLRFYILYQFSAFSSLTSELSSHLAKQARLNSAEQEATIAKSVKLCVGCGKKIKSGSLACLRCITAKIPPKKVRATQKYLPLLQEYEPPELQIWKGQPIKHSDVGNFRGSYQQYRTDTRNKISQTVRPALVQQPKECFKECPKEFPKECFKEYSFVRPAQFKRVIDIDGNSISQVVVPNSARKKEELPPFKTGRYVEIQDSFKAQNQNRPIRNGATKKRKSYLPTLNTGRTKGAQQSNIPKTLAPVYRMQVPSAIKTQGKTSRSDLASELAKYRIKNLPSENKQFEVQTNKERGLTYCEQCRGLVRGGYRYCKTRCQIDALMEISAKVERSEGMASSHLMQQMNAHMYQRLCQQSL